MELLIFILVIYFLITIFSKKPNKNNQSSSTQTEEYKKSISPNKLPQIKKEGIQKKRTDQYKPGSTEKNLKLVPKVILILSLGISLKFVRYVARRIEIRWFVVNER